ncbi:Ankyrin repeat domain-containing protein 55 [Phytophthora pseudosyringae]|uniref:Ankyrin repeat domain-containing protein 55 n=1 Tax=Phytophthora pseudosyringae TaxID=221518 RepID=A0A8T1VG80_9STRA|nr:Ankyrin repeat domain-containing protein 55 [Phytophthora pseudosyringae]
MGGILSRNSVVPQQPLSVVAASAVAQTGKAKKNKHHKFNTLVPAPQAPSQPSQSTSRSTATSNTSATKDPLSRADLRVQFLKAVKRGDVAEMADLLQRYQQPRPQSPDSHEDESEEGANEELINIRGMWESTPLISAAQYAHCEAALWLLSHGANSHSSNEKAVTALLLASLEGLTPVAVRLLESVKAKTDAPAIDKQVGVVYNSAADVNVRLSPLVAASMNGHVEIVRLLLDHGAAVNQQVVTTVCSGTSTSTVSSGGSTALLLAARYGHASVVALLLQRDADYTLLDGPTDSSALVSACEHGHEESALLLLEAMTSGSKTRRCRDTETEMWQAANLQGFTPLHFAAANGLLGVCKALLSALKTQQQSLEDEVMATAFVNGRAGARRESALLLAVRKRQHEVARLLLEAGADAELADRGGNTATQVLARNKQDALLQLCEAAINKSQHQLSSESPTVEDVLGSTDRGPHKEEELRRAESHDGATEMFADVDER